MLSRRSNLAGFFFFYMYYQPKLAALGHTYATRYAIICIQRSQTPYVTMLSFSGTPATYRA